MYRYNTTCFTGFCTHVDPPYPAHNYVQVQYNLFYWFLYTCRPSLPSPQLRRCGGGWEKRQDLGTKLSAEGPSPEVLHHFCGWPLVQECSQSGEISTPFRWTFQLRGFQWSLWVAVGLPLLFFASVIWLMHFSLGFSMLLSIFVHLEKFIVISGSAEVSPRGIQTRKWWGKEHMTKHFHLVIECGIIRICVALNCMHFYFS